jgi:Zn-dependent M16 (insulinase) family peptidase
MQQSASKLRHVTDRGSDDRWSGAVTIQVLGRMDTAKQSFKDLSQAIELNTGGISVSPTAGYWYRHDGSATPYQGLAVKSMACTRNLPRMFELLQEVLRETLFTNEELLISIVSEVRHNTCTITIARVVLKLLVCLSRHAPICKALSLTMATRMP